MRYLVTVAALVAAVTTLVHAQIQGPFDLPKPGQKTQLKNYLEAKFQDQLTRCMGKPHLTAHTGFWIFGKDVPISAVPQPLLTDGNITLDDAVLPEIDQSMARVFAYVYPTKEVQGNLQDQFLDMDYLQDPKTMLPQGESSTLYNYSCSSNISFALKANAGFTWPIAEISSALQADYSNATAAQIGMVFGTFRSPLAKYFQGSDTALRAYATLVLWEFYAQNADKRGAASPGFLLKQLDGTSSYRLFTNTQDVSGKVNFSAKLANPIVSVDTSGETQYNSQQQIYSENFSVAIKGNLVGDDFMAVPPSESINSIPTSAILDPTSTDGRLLGDSRHVQVLEGVPKQWCDSNNWHIINHQRSQIGDLNLVSGATIPADPPKGSPDGPPSCSFLVEASGPFPAGQDTIILSYSLATSLDSNDDVNDDNPATPTPSGTIIVHASNVRLSANGKPIIDPTRSRGIPTDAPSKAGGIPFDDLSYNDLTYSIEDDSNDRVATVGPHPTMSLVCGGGDDKRTIELTPSATYIPANAQLTIAVDHLANENIEKLDVNNYDTCVLTGTVDLTLATSGEVVPKPIPDTTLYYPKVKDLQGAATIASITPQSGPTGTVIILVGSGFTGTSSVSLNGKAMTTFTINSDKQITATVPPDATTGTIQVTNPSGSSSSSSTFTVTN